MTDPNTIIFHTGCWIIQVRVPSGELPAPPARQTQRACSSLRRLGKSENSTKSAGQVSSGDMKRPQKKRLCEYCLWSSGPECDDSVALIIGHFNRVAAEWQHCIYQLTSVLLKRFHRWGGRSRFCNIQSRSKCVCSSLVSTGCAMWVCTHS